MSAARTPHIVVIGAGIGGLVAALLLASRGLRVTLLERAEAPGGKLRQLVVGGRPIDSGPTVFTLRWIFDQIFDAAGSSLDDELRLRPLPLLARHHWAGADGAVSSLDLFAERDRSIDAVGALCGAAEAHRFAAFCDEALALYRLLEAPYIRSARPSFWQMVGDLGPRGLAQLAALGPFATLSRRLAHHFRDARLQQLFGRYATYCGASPWQAPATLLLVAQVEMAGVWSVDGGMHTLAQALARLAQQRGAELRYGSDVREIVLRDGRAAGVRVDDQVIAADAVLFNGDASALPLGLLGEGARSAARALRPGERSLSAVTWSMLASSDGVPLARHNVFFADPRDYHREFQDIARGRLPADPSVYLCAQDREGGQAAHRDERLLALVNAPALGDRDPPALAPSEIDACERRMHARLQRCGLTLTTMAQTVTAPREFHRLFPSSGGALYGRGFSDRLTGGWMTLFKRSGSASPIPGLYLAGGSTHPGPGVPMAAMSGHLAAATIMAHLDSISRSRRVVISGGMSTPSAMTVPTA